jgi:succinate-acetate transporter protein
MSTNAEGTSNGQNYVKDEAAVDPAVRRHLDFVSQVPNAPFNKLANPGPLGLIGFALTTFVLGLYQCGAG